MDNLNVHDLVRELTEQASGGGSGRAARTLYGGHEKTLRQTVIAMTEYHELAEHQSPGEATLLVLEGRVRLTWGNATAEGEKGDLLMIPPERHSLAALTDAAVLLTVAIR